MGCKEKVIRPMVETTKDLDQIVSKSKNTGNQLNIQSINVQETPNIQHNNINVDENISIPAKDKPKTSTSNVNIKGSPGKSQDTTDQKNTNNFIMVQSANNETPTDKVIPITTKKYNFEITSDQIKKESKNEEKNGGGSDGATFNKKFSPEHKEEKVNKIYVKNMNIEVKIEQPQPMKIQHGKNLGVEEKLIKQESKSSNRYNMKDNNKIEMQGSFRSKEFSESLFFNVEKYMNMINDIDKKKSPQISVDKYMDMINQIEQKKKEEDEEKKKRARMSTHNLIDVSKYMGMIDNIDNKSKKKKKK
jgi:hypothetical protein